MERVVVAYEASGLSRVEFCRKEGISLATLARYRKRRGHGEAVTGDRWLAVEVSGGGAVPEGGAGGGLALALPGGCRIEVGRGFDARTLARLLAVLERS